MLKPFCIASGGTLLAARQSLKTGIGVNIGGGYHHAKPDIGEGFCAYADVPIAIRKLQQEGLIKKALVIDVDVHQGSENAWHSQYLSIKRLIDSFGLKSSD